MSKPKPNNCTVKFYCDIESSETCVYYKKSEVRNNCKYYDYITEECTSSIASCNIMYRMVKFLFNKKTKEKI